jgi:hypothetical protein
MSGLKLAATRKPGPTQHRSSDIQAPPGCAVSQIVKTAQSRGRTERTLLFAVALAGRSTASPTARRGRRDRRDRRNAADKLDPSLLMSHYCLLHPTHHADKR